MTDLREREAAPQPVESHEVIEPNLAGLRQAMNKIREEVLDSGVEPISGNQEYGLKQYPIDLGHNSGEAYLVHYDVRRDELTDKPSRMRRLVRWILRRRDTKPEWRASVPIGGMETDDQLVFSLSGNDTRADVSMPKNKYRVKLRPATEDDFKQAAVALSNRPRDPETASPK